MDAATVRRLAASALNGVGLQRQGRSRWLSDSDDLVWVAELDRGSSWSNWSLELGAVVKAWSPEVHLPHYNDGQMSVDYCFLGTSVPEVAVGSRFDDHRSYFTMVFAHDHDFIDEQERADAFAFVAADVADLFQRMRRLDDLAADVRANPRSNRFVHRRLREYAELGG